MAWKQGWLPRLIPSFMLHAVVTIILFCIKKLGGTEASKSLSVYHSHPKYCVGHATSCSRTRIVTLLCTVTQSVQRTNTVMLVFQRQ